MLTAGLLTPFAIHARHNKQYEFSRPDFKIPVDVQYRRMDYYKQNNLDQAETSNRNALEYARQERSHNERIVELIDLQHKCSTTKANLQLVSRLTKEFGSDVEFTCKQLNAAKEIMISVSSKAGALQARAKMLAYADGIGDFKMLTREVLRAAENLGVRKLLE